MKIHVCTKRYDTNENTVWHKLAQKKLKVRIRKKVVSHVQKKKNVTMGIGHIQFFPQKERKIKEKTLSYRHRLLHKKRKTSYKMSQTNKVDVPHDLVSGLSTSAKGCRLRRIQSSTATLQAWVHKCSGSWEDVFFAVFIACRTSSCSSCVRIYAVVPLGDCGQQHDMYSTACWLMIMMMQTAVVYIG